MTRRATALALLIAMAVLAAGCAAGTAYRRGGAAMRAGELDQAVAYFRRAVQAAPDKPQYKIALERAMMAASRAHFEKAREFEQNDQLEAALSEYRLASEYDPSNRQAASKVTTIDRTIRERIEAARPRPAGEQMRARARQATAEPMINPASREPLNMRFTNASLKDILNAIGGATGINITYDREVQDRPATIQLDGVTLEQALNQIMLTNQLSYKILSDRSILVFPDTTQKHTQYDDQVIRTFYVSHADATEITQLLSTIIRLPGIAVQPAIAVNKTTNTITVRGTTPIVQILEKIIEQNDKPRAEVVFDIEILEVDRSRAKQYGLNLTDYALGSIFSPAVAPGQAAAATPGTTPAASTTGTNPLGVTSPPIFNLNTISQGVSTADFYLAVPAAVVKFLESDNHTRLVAKPQLRGAEGTKMTLNLGDEIPIVSTSYTPIATGGASVNPLNSFQLKPVGINIDITPRVTLDGDILIELNVESSSKGPNVSVAGTDYPSFGSRKVGTRLRLRDGESNLLAGLIREDETQNIQGFPGAVHVPFFKQLFSANVTTNAQTDIVMLLTPRIVRTNEITDADLRPIYIGSQQNLGVGGPPPLIAPFAGAEGVAPAPAPAPAAPPAAAPGAPRPAPGAPAGATPGAAPIGTPPVQPGVPVPPPGSSPVPGTVLVPPPATAPPAAAPPPAPVETPPAQPAPPPPAAPATAPTTPAPTAPATPEPATSPGIGSAQVVISPPGTAFRVGGGPYTVPISIVNVSRLSTVTLTVIFDPAVLRVRSVQEGSFLRTGGGNVTFGQQVSGNRIDITLTRAGDTTGASGTGLLAAVLFDAIAPGSVTLTLSGTATGPGGTPMGLQFRPVTIVVQQ